MPKEDLASKYGKSKNLRQLINAAIRAELPGGNEALDALDLLNRRGHREAVEAVSRIIDALADEIRRRYDLPQTE